jgi:exonuclease VII small subunit/uncharacterized protein (UPF0335 family)
VKIKESGVATKEAYRKHDAIAEEVRKLKKGKDKLEKPNEKFWELLSDDTREYIQALEGLVSIYKKGYNDLGNLIEESEGAVLDEVSAVYQEGLKAKEDAEALAIRAKQEIEAVRQQADKEIAAVKKQATQYLEKAKSIVDTTNSKNDELTLALQTTTVENIALKSGNETLKADNSTLKTENKELSQEISSIGHDLANNVAVELIVSKYKRLKEAYSNAKRILDGYLHGFGGR